MQDACAFTWTTLNDVNDGGCSWSLNTWKPLEQQCPRLPVARFPHPIKSSNRCHEFTWWVVTGLHDWIVFSRFIGNGIIFPIDELIFFRGVGIPGTRNHDFPMQKVYFFNPHFEIHFSDISYPYHIWSPEVRPDSVVNIGWTNSPTVKPKPLLVDVPDVNKCLLIGLCPKCPLRRRS